jgi:hypothetical protein
MSATTFLSRIFLSLFFFPFVSNEQKWKEDEEEEEEEEEEQGEVEEDNDEEDEGDEVELLLACNNTSARFIANSTDLHSTLRFISFCKLKKLRVLWWKFFQSFVCLIVCCLPLFFLCFFPPLSFGLRILFCSLFFPSPSSSAL